MFFVFLATIFIFICLPMLAWIAFRDDSAPVEIAPLAPMAPIFVTRDYSIR